VRYRGKVLKNWFIVILITLCAGCAFFWDDEKDDPVSCFEYMWSEMKYYYPGFIDSDVDWDALRDKYLPQIRKNPTSATLKRVIKEIIDTLNDAHILAVFDRDEQYPPFQEVLFSISVVDEYFNLEYVGVNYAFGRRGDVGYLYIVSFGGEEDAMIVSSWAKEITGVLKKLDDCSVLIVDIRENPGGSALNVQHIAGNFILKSYPGYARHIYKTGRAYSQYCSADEDLKKGSYTFPRPVIVLMNKGSVSSADFFGAIMSHCTDAVLVGENNAFSSIGDTEPTELPNGWIIQFGKLASELFDGEFKEGDIILMDYEVTNTSEEQKAGIDTQLEFALGLAESE